MKVSEIKNDIAIEGVIEQYIDIERAMGDEYKAVCPFHDDNDPSLFINTDKNVYHCQGCGASGDTIDFVREYEGVTFKEAVEIITGESFSNQKIVFDSQTKTQESLLELVDKEDNQTINENLVEEYSQYTHQYLLDKGFSQEILEEYDVGYSADPFDDLHNRVIFAWRNIDGDLVAVAGRDVTDEHDAKYKTKKGGSKAKTFYNAHRVSQLDTNEVIVVEDEKSVLRLAQWGYKNAVALGNNDLGERKWILRQLGSTAVLCFDSDEEGVNGRNKAIKKILALMNVEVIELPEEYKDIADIEDKSIFDKCYKNRDKL